MKKVRVILVLLGLLITSTSPFTITANAWDRNIMSVTPFVVENIVQNINVYSTSVAPTKYPSSLVPISKITTSSLGTRFVVVAVSVSPRNIYYALSSNHIVAANQFKKSTLTYNDLYVPGTVKSFYIPNTVNSPDIRVYKTNKINVPIWEHPISTSFKKQNLAATGTSVAIVGEVTNKYGSKFYRTSSGGYIFSGNLIRVQWIKPAIGVITSKFGEIRETGVHQGIDIASRIGSDILASRGGEVVESYYSSGTAGRLIVIKHVLDDEKTIIFSSYFHLEVSYVKKGDKVVQGQRIALMGNTGRSSGPHLHFGISKSTWSSYMDPNGTNFLNGYSSPFLCTKNCR